MYDSVTLNLIKTLLEAYRSVDNTNATAQNKSDWNYTLCKDGVEYLLNQALRQPWLPQDHYLVSVEAKKWWDEYADGDILLSYYQKPVYLKKEIKELPYYKGNKHEGLKYDYKIGEHFSYRSYFHDEHIVPVYEIERELLELEDITLENIDKVLQKIYICKMLKEENFNLPVKRYGDNYIDIIKNDYHPHGIHIVGEERFLCNNL